MQPTLFDEPAFDGATFNPLYDEDRLRTLLGRVFDLMLDGEWRTLREIQSRTRGSETAISARLRDFRKPKFGGHAVHRRRRGDCLLGLHEYRLEVRG